MKYFNSTHVYTGKWSPFRRKLKHSIIKISSAICWPSSALDGDRLIADLNYKQAFSFPTLSIIETKTMRWIICNNQQWCSHQWENESITLSRKKISKTIYALIQYFLYTEKPCITWRAFAWMRHQKGSSEHQSQSHAIMTWFRYFSATSK